MLLSKIKERNIDLFHAMEVMYQAGIKYLSIDKFGTVRIHDAKPTPCNIHHIWTDLIDGGKRIIDSFPLTIQERNAWYLNVYDFEKWESKYGIQEHKELTVIVRDDEPHKYGDNSSYRTIQIKLTNEQLKQLELKNTEQISQSIIELGD